MIKPAWFTRMWEEKAGWEPLHLRPLPISVHSSWGNPNESWTHIAVGPNTDSVLFNKYDKAIFPRCYWCGADAVFYVDRTSSFTGRRYYDHACDFHMKEWKPK